MFVRKLQESPQSRLGGEMTNPITVDTQFSVPRHIQTAQNTVLPSGKWQPDANGEFKTPADGAKFMASFGIPQIPLRGKIPNYMPDWPAKATCDFNQIDDWALEYPSCNFGSVARNHEFFVFETDSTEPRNRFKKTGHDFSSKLIIESRAGRGHRYYRWVNGVENIAQGPNSKFGDYSVRVGNEQCVSPGSIHPMSGKQYRVIKYAAPEFPSQAEIDFWKSEQVQRESIGIHSAISSGRRNVTLCSLAGKMRDLGFDKEKLLSELREINSVRCEPPLQDSEIESIAASVAKYPDGITKRIERASAIVWKETPAENLEIEEPETLPEVLPECLPEFPILPGLLTELSEAICPDIPREFKLMAAVTIWGLIRSGRDTLQGEHLQPRFYTCFVKEPGWGKSAAINEIRNAMSMLSPPDEIAYVPSVDSGPALVDELKELSDKAGMRAVSEISRIKFAKCLLVPDEMTDLFEKAKQTNQSKNTLFSELLKLYEGNETGNRARVNQKKGRLVVSNAHLALLAGATPFGYETMWTATGGGATGLQSRGVVITTSAARMPINKTQTDFQKMADVISRLNKLASLDPREFRLTDAGRQMLQTWWASKSSELANNRADDMVKRMLIVLAGSQEEDAFCDPLLIDTGMVELACQFGDYVIACREKFNVSDSHSWVQAAELAIMKIARKHGSLTKNNLRRLTNADKRPGGLGPFNQALKNLVENDMLILDGQSRKGQNKYRPERL
jgi:hypothetical protein